MFETGLLGLATAAIAFLLIGLAIGFFISRITGAADRNVLAEQVRSEVATEVATLRERVRGMESELQRANTKASELESENRALRNDLDLARDERAQNAERASRVPDLELQLGRQLAQLEASQADVLRLSKSEAEKTSEIVGLSERQTELSVQLQETVNRLEISQQSLSHSEAEVSRLKADNAQIPNLIEKVSVLEQDATRFQSMIATLREDNGRLQAEREAEEAAHALVKSDLANAKSELESSSALISTQRSNLAELTTRLDSERLQASEKLALLIEAKDALSNQFKSLASDILEEKSKRFAEQNQASLGQLLDPLKVRLQEFQGKVELFYDTEGKQRSALSQQVTQLLDLNRTLSDDAKNLTSALKGSSKSQGNWGELILERVLEASGLRKGDEYDVQESHTREDGSRHQPDVVIHLPEDRHLIVDAKVSLSAYEEYVSSDDEAAKQVLLRRHLDSIRNHIKGLSDKNYQTLYGLKSLDFVLMFIPIEPAFMLGVTQDNKLFMDAWSKNVLLVSPSTLLFVVRTVAHLWRQEAQSKNAQEIAKRGAELYDRLSAFVSDLEAIGDRLNQAQASYSEAVKKLTTNKGNVIRQAEMLKELGVKPTKTISPTFIEQSGLLSNS